MLDIYLYKQTKNYLNLSCFWNMNVIVLLPTYNMELDCYNNGLGYDYYCYYYYYDTYYCCISSSLLFRFSIRV